MRKGPMTQLRTRVRTTRWVSAKTSRILFQRTLASGGKIIRMRPMAVFGGGWVGGWVGGWLEEGV